jgi:hypothetical protein
MSIAALTAIAADLDTADYIEAGYNLKDACILAIADDDDAISALASEATEHGDDVMAMRARDALQTRHGGGPDTQRFEVARVIFEAKMNAMEYIKGCDEEEGPTSYADAAAIFAALFDRLPNAEDGNAGDLWSHCCAAVND